MVDLVPRPFPQLVSRMFRELEQCDAIFDLPRARFFGCAPTLTDLDLGVRFHGHAAATPLGPAAGPHSQLAQNIVLAWLGGSRLIELKTVQVQDQLSIPRPCIDMRNVGYNVEWSQELRLAESLEEYVKASMLIELLLASGRLGLAAGLEPTVFDMSVGYDLDGIRSPGVAAFLDGMADASALVSELRAQIPSELGALRDLPFRTTLADTLTLSTFHGCPPNEIEGIVDHLLRERGLHCVIKLNPTLLGADELRGLLHDELGYHDVTVPEQAFDADTTWKQATGFVERLRATASGLGLGLGVKLTNTLVVEHQGDFLPASEERKYLSGRPLHVLAMHLVARFRERFGAGLPLSFSAGIDRSNFADAVALGLTPITVCSDLLGPGGYGRQAAYFSALAERMRACGARNVEQFILATAGKQTTLPTSGQPTAPDEGRRSHDANLLQAMLINTRTYVAGLTGDPRYGRAANTRTPRKVGSTLQLFDCLTCDKCIPVCPNDANFRLDIAPREIESYVLEPGTNGWQVRDRCTLSLAKRHQIANFADACNECGNCDVFCPEDGGPYLLKPRFFGSLAEWRRHAHLDGFFVEPIAGEEAAAGTAAGIAGGISVGTATCLHARLDGVESRARFSPDGQVLYTGDGFEISFVAHDPAGSVQGRADGPVDLKACLIMDVLREALLETRDVNWVNVG